MDNETPSDKLLQEYLVAEFKVLNAHIPRNRRSLLSLLKEKYPCVESNDGSAHFFKKKELEYLATLLREEDQNLLLLPILMEITPGQNEVVIIGESGIEEKVLTVVLGMPVTRIQGKITIYKSQLSDIRSALRTTTQYVFSPKGI
ncbi:MAG: DUF61 family protein [Chloroflexi bacterium]|nr:DUF61 family protein [Chloroflexota bacterium]